MRELNSSKPVAFFIAVILCYIDESGTPQIPGNTSHYVLCGLSIPIFKWKACETQIASIKRKYGLVDKEIHTAWLLRPYPQQRKVPDFEKIDYAKRTFEVSGLRTSELLKLQRKGKSRLYHQTKKNYRKTLAYIHLTFDERKALVEEFAKMIGKWRFARIFAECIDKRYFDTSRGSIDEQGFEQLVSRFERYLQLTGTGEDEVNYGMLIHDNNETVAKRHTNLMKNFYQRGTLWTSIKNIIETPLFVDSSLTSMIQMADLCSYAIRRYLENNEERLFNQIYSRADRKDGVVVGIRHFAPDKCSCKICHDHNVSRRGYLFYL